MEGYIAAADCAGRPGKVSVSLGKTTMNFHFQDITGVQVVSTAKQDSGQTPACGDWKNRRVRLYFYKTKDKSFAGNVNTIQFF